MEKNSLVKGPFNLLARFKKNMRTKLDAEHYAQGNTKSLLINSLRPGLKRPQTVLQLGVERTEKICVGSGIGYVN